MLAKYVVQVMPTLSHSSKLRQLDKQPYPIIKMRLLPKQRQTILDYLFTTIRIGLFSFAIITVTDIIYPHISAHLETKNILQEMGIPESKKGAPAYRYRSIWALKAYCKNGIDEASYYDFQCNAQSPTYYWTRRLFSAIKTYQEQNEILY